MKNNKLRYQVAAGVVLIFVGITLLLSNYISDKRDQVFSSMNLELSKEVPELTKKDDKKEEKKEKKKEEVSDNTGSSQDANYESYAGTLEISKIGFNKGFYAKGSSLNNVKFNIKILDVSSYPDEDRGNVIIIGHSGNYSNSYFANLYKLSVGDSAVINYNSKKYTYKIVNIYNDDKDGTVTVYRDETKSTLTLITCTKDDDTKQTIYISELQSVE